MKIKTLPAFFCVLALLFYSCEGFFGDGLPEKPDVAPRTFWAQDFRYEESFYSLTAELFVEGQYCNIWVENTSGVDMATAKKVADAFDKIYPQMINTFGFTERFITGTGPNMSVLILNTMEYADRQGDMDGKLCILLLDIADSYQPGVNDAYSAGYFWGGNFYQPKDVKYSNTCDMIYIDTNPGILGSLDSNATLAHEMQHLMNFITSASGIYRENLMDTWIDEGLSSAAEYLVTGVHSEGRWLWYNEDPSELISRGNNFFVWGNREAENQYAALDDYSTVYLFFQWLRLQGGSGIYKDIITSPSYDYRAVTSAANNAIGGEGYNDWGTLLKTWMAANYFNDPTGKFGYQNEYDLREIRANTVSGVTTVNLFPGEGVYSVTGEDFPFPGQGANIKYAGLTEEEPRLDDTAIFPEGALLTYNTNTDTLGGTETGTTTGSPAPSADTVPRGRSVGRTLSGPFAIGAGDMLRLNGHKQNPVQNLDLSKFLQETPARE